MIVRQTTLGLIFWVLIAAWPAHAFNLEALDARHRAAKTFEDYRQLEQVLLEQMEREPAFLPRQWRLARAYFDLGREVLDTDRKKTYFLKCVARAEDIVKTAPKTAEGHYFRALCRGKLGQTEGLWSSFSIIKPFEEGMKIALGIDPSVEHAGPHRALGRLYQDLPALLGGDPQKALFHLQKAVEISPDYSDNTLFLARIYHELGRDREALNVLSAFMQSGRGEDESFRSGRDLLKTIQTSIDRTLSHAQGTSDP